MIISLIVGARANLLKAAPVIHEIRRRQPGWTARVIYTGRLGDEEIAATLFDELQLAAPDSCLEVETGSHLARTIGIMSGLQEEFEGARPEAAIVFGDVCATLAGSLAAADLGIPVAHVEAGLRSFNRRTHGEMNRVVADAVSEWLFTTQREADVNLRAEGIPDRKIHFVGNTMIDTLLRHRARAGRLRVAEAMGLTRPYVVVALSKAENVDDGSQLRSIAYALVTLADEFDVVWSVRPHDSDRIETFDLSDVLNGHQRLHLLPTTGYVEFIGLMNDAAAVLTDSGGVQEEALVIGAPCVTLRHYTKHQVTLAHGGNRLAGGDPHLAARYVREAIRSRSGFAPIPERWDGNAASRIVEVLEKDFARPVSPVVPGPAERF